MGFGISGLLQGISGSSDSDLYGKKPVVPGAVDYGSAIGNAIQSNITNLPSLMELANLSTDAMSDLLERSLPGYKTLRDAGTNTLTNWAQGQLTPEMDADLQRRAAEQGITLGTSGSNFGVHRGLKLNMDTRLGLQERGLNSGAAWINQARNNTFDFSKMFMNTQDAMRQADSTWSRDWLAAQVKASPDPAARGAFDSEMAFIGMVLSAYGGGAGYTGQYKGGATGGGGPGYGGGAGGGYSFFGGPSGYGSTYPGYGNQTYQSVPTDSEGGGMSIPLMGGGG